MSKSTLAMALAGISPHLQGANTPIAYCSAAYQASEGRPVFPCEFESWPKSARNAATCDLQLIRRVFEAEPHLDWRLRCLPEDGVHCLYFPRERDLRHLENDFGPLARTWVIERDGGPAYHIFERGILDPELRLHKEISDTHARLSSHAPLPGSRHKSGERWRWRPGHEMGVQKLSFLPRSWLSSLPKKTGTGITAVTTERPEFRPHSPLWSGH